MLAYLLTVLAGAFAGPYGPGSHVVNGSAGPTHGFQGEGLRPAWTTLQWLPAALKGQCMEWEKELWILPVVLVWLRVAGLSCGFLEGVGF